MKEKEFKDKDKDIDEMNFFLFERFKRIEKENHEKWRNQL
jgi:hypothetical protein